MTNGKQINKISPREKGQMSDAKKKKKKNLESHQTILPSAGSRPVAPTNREKKKKPKKKRLPCVRPKEGKGPPEK